MHATSTSYGLSKAHMNAFEQLKTGSANDRLAAAHTLRYAITEYPLNPVLDIWYAAKDLIEPKNPPALRIAGWELLTECVKHTSSTDLERKEYFQTLTAPADPDDFHLQLAALVDLTRGGRSLAGFDYELLPILTKWLDEAYNAARAARRSASQSSKVVKTSTRKATVAGEDQNFAQLFSFLQDVIKFSFNNANETSTSALIETLLNICLNTSAEDDLKACISTIDAIVTFGSIPNDKLQDCVRVLSSIYCLVPNLEKESWHTLSNLCKSHNGQATVRILLDILRNSPNESANNKDTSREVRGALAALQKLLSKNAENGYPAVPYALLVDGLANAIKVSESPRVYFSVLQLVNSLFDNGEGATHRIIVDEDWSVALEVSTDCFKKLAKADLERMIGSSSKEDTPEGHILMELLSLVGRLDSLMNFKTDEFMPKQRIIKFFTEVQHILPDPAVRTVLSYFQQFRCCAPSDLEWEENISLVLNAFFLNHSRPSDTRLLAFKTIIDAYEVVELVGDGAEQTFIPRLAKDVLNDVGNETDVKVLPSIINFITSVSDSCDMELFSQIIDTLKRVVLNDQLKSPVLAPTISASSFEADPDRSTSIDTESLSNIITKGLVTMFLSQMNMRSDKSTIVFRALVNIAKSPQCDLDARLTAMKLLFRLRADWADRIFVTDNLGIEFLAASICRTEAAIAKKKGEEAAQSLRLSRNDHSAPTRTSRGVSFSQSHAERNLPIRSLSGASGKPSSQYQQMWKYPDTNALPISPPKAISPVLVSYVVEDASESDNNGSTNPSVALDVASWLDAVLTMLHGSDWEIYSFVLVHLPSQLSNHAIFKGAIPQIKELRRIICDQVRHNAFQEPPNIFGLRRADVAICLYQSLTMILSYHEYFLKADEDEIVQTFVAGIATFERSAIICIHALSICCHELPLSASKSLVQMLNHMASIITQPHVSIHILEFLATLSRLHNVYVNFREEEFKIVFTICFKYLDYAREKRRSNRSSRTSEPSTPSTPQTGSVDASHPNATDDLPQYVHSLAYHVVIFWFLALKLPDRANHVPLIARKLFAELETPGQPMEEQAITSMDFIQRVTFADVDESAEDPYFTEERFGEIGKKRWIIGNSIVTVKQGTITGWAQVIKRQPSGTSAYTIRETYRPPPPHQIENHVDITREGKATTNAILPSHLLVQLMSSIPQTMDAGRPIPLPNDDVVDRAIRVFDRNSTVDGHKVGVIYIGEGQTDEVEILANVSGSTDYIEFLNNLGTLTKLKGATFNTQGLDREYDTDGEYTFCWRDRVTEIVFHVTTQMPTNLERDPQCIAKKRHIGNDFVNIIFNDSGLPFKFDTFPSQFNFVNIVIAPASRATFIAMREADKSGDTKQPFYMVQVMSRPGFPEISPASETKMISLTALPEFIRLVALNASMFSLVWNNRRGGEHTSSWTARLREINRLRERYTVKHAPVTPSPPPSAFGGSLHGVANESSRPTSTVRDSFHNLRRTSVATFFTNNSENPSQRSSMTSTAGTSETEIGSPAGQSHGYATSSLVDSVDFSKWT